MENKEQTDIKSLTLEELTQYVQTELGEKAFRATQLYQWMHARMAISYEQMSNLSKALREELAKKTTYTVLEKETVQISQIDGTRKYLFRLADGNVIESVLMRYRHGNSVCISSQVGCRMGCRFCASTLDGLVRNLTPAEMLDQIYRMSTDIGERISNVVVMGTGEPLDNYENLVKFIHILSSKEGLNISQRNITVSTCGIVPGIRRLAEENLQITLALSLHASSQERRLTLMPVANRYDLSEVLAACNDYFEKTGRRMTYEYSLVSGVNDSEEDARKLAALLHGQNCHVNLIPVNPIKERNYVKPSTQATAAFKNRLEKYGINVTIRRSLGGDIDGACGQLRKKFSERRETIE